MTRKRKGKSLLIKISVVLMTLIFFSALYLGYKIFGPNTGNIKEDSYLYIPTGSSYKEILNILYENNFVKDLHSFDLIARKAGYDTKHKAGRYKIKKRMSNYTMVKLLRSGRQDPVKFVLNKVRTKDDFIRFTSHRLEADSNELKKLMSDELFLAGFGLDTFKVMCAVMPDTYEFWWNVSPDNFLRKIFKNYELFWNDARKTKAQLLGFSPQEIIILSSIAEEETTKQTEIPTIASVYINRLNRGMKLQADPTVKFALGDFSIRRILNIHLKTASPYNTYMNHGLPPGPICTPSKTTIDGVLNTTPTKYYYFCAKADLSGYHAFAESYQEHLINASEYWKALNQRGIN